MFVGGQQKFFNLDFKGVLWKRSLIIWHLNLLWYIKVSQKNIIGFVVRLKEQKDFWLSVKPCISESWICTCTAVSSFSFSSSHFFSLFQYSCSASSTSVSFFSHFLSLFFWIFNKVNIQFWGYGFAFLIWKLPFIFQWLTIQVDYSKMLDIYSTITRSGSISGFNSPLLVNTSSSTVPSAWLSILDCLSQSRGPLVVILLDLSPVLQTDFLLYIASLSRIENVSNISRGHK